MAESSQLAQLVAASFPIQATNSLGSLDVIEVTEREGHLWLVARLIVWEARGDTLSIRDVKEQEVRFMPLTKDLARVEQFLRGFAQVMSHVLANPELDTLMPHELLDGRALALAKASTEQDFVKALSVKSRLGRYLPA